MHAQNISLEGRKKLPLHEFSLSKFSLARSNHNRTGIETQVGEDLNSTDPGIRRRSQYHSRLVPHIRLPQLEFLNVKLRNSMTREGAAMRRTRLIIVFLVCAAAFVFGRAWAQVPKTAVAKQKPGGLNGDVVNAKGSPVAGAQILWQAADGEKPHVLHSDAQGRFHIGPLRSGQYDFRASARRTWPHCTPNVLFLPAHTATWT